MLRLIAVVPFLLLMLQAPVLAAGSDLGSMGLQWVIPFAGILLSIALFPLLAPSFWHHHYGKIALGWAVLFLGPFIFSFGFSTALDEVLHVYVLEFIPFIILLWALYTVAGGVHVRGALRGSPKVNAVILLLGTVLASWMGTTGAAMLLIRPLIRANAWRKKKTHLIVFFIFLVANVGGSLTPLGDPPLFLGFLHGVDFFWTTSHMLMPMLVCVGVLIVVCYIFDAYLLSKEEHQTPPETGVDEGRLGLDGKINFLFLIGVVAAILYSGAESKGDLYWDQAPVDAAQAELAIEEAKVVTARETLASVPEAGKDKAVRDLLLAQASVNGVRSAAEHHAVKGWHVTSHVTWPWINMVRDGVLILMGMLSLWFTSREIRRKNDFTWFPIVEVGKLFAGIFVTIIPAIAILKAGPSGALDSVVMAVTNGAGNPIDAMYFWLTGGLSSFLDNAPTYLVFFNTAGGNAEVLQDAQSRTLLAISAGAVFMGANTYIGNAPNFMVRSIAEEAGITMPTFFGYLLKWSLPILVPVFILISFLFFS